MIPNDEVSRQEFTRRLRDDLKDQTPRAPALTEAEVGALVEAKLREFLNLSNDASEEAIEAAVRDCFDRSDNFPGRATP